MVDVTPNLQWGASDDSVRDEVARLCRDSRGHAISIYAGEGGIPATRLQKIQDALAACTQFDAPGS